MNYKFVRVDNATGADQTRWILPTPVTVGRSPTADISIGDASISRQHCRFTVDSQGALVVRDLGSMNGVYVDNRRVDRAVVRPGVVVQIGAVSLRPELTEDETVEGDPGCPTWDLDATQKMKAIDPEQALDQFKNEH